MSKMYNYGRQAKSLQNKYSPRVKKAASDFRRGYTQNSEYTSPYAASDDYEEEYEAPGNPYAASDDYEDEYEAPGNPYAASDDYEDEYEAPGNPYAASDDYEEEYEAPGNPYAASDDYEDEYEAPGNPYAASDDYEDEYEAPGNPYAASDDYEDEYEAPGNPYGNDTIYPTSAFSQGGGVESYNDIMNPSVDTYYNASPDMGYGGVYDPSSGGFYDVSPNGYEETVIVQGPSTDYDIQSALNDLLYSALFYNGAPLQVYKHGGASKIKGDNNRIIDATDNRSAERSNINNSNGRLINGDVGGNAKFSEGGYRVTNSGKMVNGNVGGNVVYEARPGTFEDMYNTGKALGRDVGKVAKKGAKAVQRRLNERAIGGVMQRERKAGGVMRKASGGSTDVSLDQTATSGDATGAYGLTGPDQSGGNYFTTNFAPIPQMPINMNYRNGGATMLKANPGRIRKRGTRGNHKLSQVKSQMIGELRQLQRQKGFRGDSTLKGLDGMIQNLGGRTGRVFGDILSSKSRTSADTHQTNTRKDFNNINNIQQTNQQQGNGMLYNDYGMFGSNGVLN